MTQGNEKIIQILNEPMNSKRPNSLNDSGDINALKIPKAPKIEAKIIINETNQNDSKRDKEGKRGQYETKHGKKIEKEINIEEVFWRFPHVGGQILEKLDNLSLTKCQEVSKNWQYFVNEQKILYVQKIQANIYISNKQIRKTLFKQRLETLKEVEKYSKHVNHRVNLKRTILSEEAGSTEILHELIARKEPEASFLWKLVQDNKKNKNPIDQTGYSILHHIALCYPEETEKFRMVMDSLENKNPKNHYSLTPLFLAAGEGHIEICKLILQNVHDKNPKDYKGRTLLDLAEENGHEEICNLIKSFF